MTGATDGNGNGYKTKVALAFAVAILAVWAAAFIFGMVTGDFSAFSLSTPVLLISAGFLFGYKPGGKNGSS